MELDDNGLEVLDPSTCRALLATICIGRVALSRQALPIILPVIYAVAEGEILIPASTPLLRRAATSGDVTCFEADAHDADGAMWSVLVIGNLAFTDARQGSRDGRDPAMRSGDPLVTVQPSMISGRRTTRSVHNLRWSPVTEESRR